MFNLFFLYLFTYVLSTDPGVHLTNCDNNNKLNVLFYKRDNTTAEVPPMIEGVECNTKCPEGQFITYSLQNKSLSCQNCPANTFSTGGQMRICGTKREWKDSLISEIQNDCFITVDEEVFHGNCTKWQPHETQGRIVSGSTDVEEAWYNGLLSYNVRLKNKGSVRINF
jgi:hypothetical protein